MRERPILMQGRLVRKTLRDEKTQTRRVVQIPDAVGPITRCRGYDEFQQRWWFTTEGDDRRASHLVRCPYGGPGDRLYVRETFRLWERVFQGHADYVPWPGGLTDPEAPRRCMVDYAATSDVSSDYPWRPSIHMPRWASRLDLEVVDIRVERIQDIGTEDCIAEGVEFWVPGSPEGSFKAFDGSWHVTAQEAFRVGWDEINGSRGLGWNVNPFVWVVGFKRVVGRDMSARHGV